MVASRLPTSASEPPVSIGRTLPAASPTISRSRASASRASSSAATSGRDFRRPGSPPFGRRRACGAAGRRRHAATYWFTASASTWSRKSLAAASLRSTRRRSPELAWHPWSPKLAQTTDRTIENMEAPGIEPGSERFSTIGPTRVSRRIYVSGCLRACHPSRSHPLISPWARRFASCPEPAGAVVLARYPAITGGRVAYL